MKRCAVFCCYVSSRRESELTASKIIVENPKDESFTAINPNGRLPAIKDHNNNDLILWESGAIVEYLVETYDKKGKLTLTGNADKWHLKQYLHFQMSGQVGSSSYQGRPWA